MSLKAKVVGFGRLGDPKVILPDGKQVFLKHAPEDINVGDKLWVDVIKQSKHHDRFVVVPRLDKYANEKYRDGRATLKRIDELLDEEKTRGNHESYRERISLDMFFSNGLYNPKLRPIPSVYTNRLSTGHEIPLLVLWDVKHRGKTEFGFLFPQEIYAKVLKQIEDPHCARIYESTEEDFERLWKELEIAPDADLSYLVKRFPSKYKGDKTEPIKRLLNFYNTFFAATDVLLYNFSESVEPEIIEYANKIFKVADLRFDERKLDKTKYSERQPILGISIAEI